MNSFKGKIIDITSSGSVSIVKIAVKDKIISSIVLNSDTSSYIKLDKEVTILFKETEVIIGKGEIGNISLQNKFYGPIIKLEKGSVLSTLTVQTSIGTVESMITTNALIQLKLSINDTVTTMVKSNEIMLSI